MSTEILINLTATETRVAVVENGLLQELAIERGHPQDHADSGAGGKSIVGNIYKGKVARVMPGMQSAFIDIGLDKAGFIHVDDICRAKEGDAPAPDIRQLLHEGKTVVVQAIKDSIGTKGARLSTRLSVSSRYLVYMPDVDHIGISQRIEQESERERLRQRLEQALNEAAIPEGKRGYILRTAAENATEAELLDDLHLLHLLWQDVAQAIPNAAAPVRVHTDLSLPLRTLRDKLGGGVEKIRVDDAAVCRQLQHFAARINAAPQLAIEYYQGDRPLFQLYGIEDEITRALDRSVPLKSGGYLVIDQTEAMTTVDVNTGAFIGHHNLEETIFRTNLEAAAALGRQLRLRNLGGIIIIDFIDMQDTEHQRQVLRALEKVLEKDRVKTAITGVSALGLVAMTRKRTNESLGQMLCDPCPLCQGRGKLKSAETVSYEILREILKTAQQFDSTQILVLAAQEVIDRLLDETATQVADLEARLGRSIQFRVENLYSREQFDIIPV